MKQQSRHSKESQFIDSDFAEALCEGESGRRSADRQAQRKTLQLCRQVQRALILALANCHAGDDLNGLFIEDVLPAPDCGHLLVYVVVPAGRPVVDALHALRRDAARLRSEVAMAITRKRAPQLSFVPAFEDGGNDE